MVRAEAVRRGTLAMRTVPGIGWHSDDSHQIDALPFSPSTLLVLSFRTATHIFRASPALRGWPLQVPE